MFYDARELRALSILKKVKKHPGLQAADENELIYSCIAVVSYLLLRGEALASMPISIDEMTGIGEHAQEAEIPHNNAHLPHLFEALHSPFQGLGTRGTTEFLNYLIDRCIKRLTQVEPRHCKIVSGFAGTVLNHLQYDVIDVVPNVADLSLGTKSQGIKHSFLMSGRISKAQYNLIKLKLHCSQINIRFVDRPRNLPNPNEHRAYLIDAPLPTNLSVVQDKLIHEMASEEILEQIPGDLGDGSLYILTRSANGVNSAEFKRSWQRYHRSMEAVIAFDSYHDNILKKFIFIVLNRQNTRNGACLYINLSNNPAIQHLDAIERSMLAGAVYLSWRFNVHSVKNISENATSLWNSHFKNGYRNVNGLCNEILQTPVPNRHLFNVKRHVNFAERKTITQDYNVEELLEHLNSATPTCLYIMGNNGSGKSSLLGKLATQITENKQPSTGITLSQSSRFPKMSGNEHFLSYCLKSRSPKYLSEIVPKLISALCRDVKKLDTFNRCLELLDFTQNLYLGPKPHSDESFDVNIEHLISIGESAIENDESLRDLHEESLAFYLVKKSSPDNYIIFSELSSGERNIIALLALCIDSSTRGKIVLLDEPEISLHVRWQQRFPLLLEIISQHLKVSFITATHSPLLISNAPLDNTHAYTLKTGNLEYIEAAKRRSVETALVSVFDTYTPLNKEVYERCARLVALTIEGKNSQTKQFKKFYNDNLKQLKDLKITVKASSVINHESRHKSDLDLINKAMVAIKAVRDEASDASA
jgi:predicted ATPase